MSTAEEMSNDKPPSELLDEIHKFVGRFIAYPSEHAHVAHVLWIVHTHLMEAWDSTPRLAFLSAEPASGKTRALEITELLVPNPVEAINVTPAYLFRKVGADDAKPTILYDEIDTVFGPKAKENEEIRGLLNAGHRRGAVAGRCVVRGKTVETEEISAFCAVAMAGLGWLPDTILTRAVIERMRRRAPNEKITPFRRRVHGAEGNALRDRLAAWAAGVVQEMADARPVMPPGIEDRDADVWEPLLAIADGAGGDWPDRARDAAKALVGAARDAEPSLGLRLLADPRTIFQTSTLDALPTSILIDRLGDLDESPWAEFRGGKGIDGRTLAKRLRQYGVKSKQIRISEDKTVKGYAREDLHDAWLRYLPPSDAEEAKQAKQAKQALENGGFLQENVSDGPDAERNNPGAERNNASDVSDSERNNETKRNGNSSTGSSTVSDVSDVSLPGANRGERICAQCNAGGEPLLLIDGVLLHVECRRFWGKPDPWAGLDIPDFLDRTAELRSEETP